MCQPGLYQRFPPAPTWNDERAGLYFVDVPGAAQSNLVIGRLALAATDEEALEGVKLLSRSEGIIPALETAHAIGALKRIATEIGNQATVVINISGRGDKDMPTLSKFIGRDHTSIEVAA